VIIALSDSISLVEPIHYRRKMSSICGERVRARMALVSAGAEGLGTAWSAGVAVSSSGAVLPPSTTPAERINMESKPRARAAKVQTNSAANELVRPVRRTLCV